MDVNSLGKNARVYPMASPSSGSGPPHGSGGPSSVERQHSLNGGHAKTTTTAAVPGGGYESDGSAAWAVPRRNSAPLTDDLRSGAELSMTGDSIGSSTEGIAKGRGGPHSIENGPSSGGGGTERDPVSNSDSKDVNVDFSNVNDAHSPISKSKVDVHGYSVQHMSAPYRRLEHPADKSMTVSFLGSLFFLVAALIVFCPTMVVLVLLLPLAALVKQCMLCCCCAKPDRTCLCCCSRMLNHSDAIWLHDSKLNRAIMHSLVTLETGLDVLRIRQFIDAKLVSAENMRGQRIYPRFRQKVVRMKTGHMWVTDDNFNMERHVYSMPLTILTQADLEAHIADVASKPFAPDQPPWDVQVLEEFGEKKDTVLLVRVHQCMSDGVALLQVLLAALVDEYALYSQKARCGRLMMLLNTLRALCIGPIVFLHRWLLTRQDFNMIHSTPRTGKKVVAWSEPYSVGRAIRIKQVTRSTLNDVLLSVASGCVRTYLQARGVGNPYDMLVTIPMDIRASASVHKLGNRVAYVNVSLPTNTEGSIPRLWQIKQTMEEAKKSADSFVMYGAQWLLTLVLPACLWQRIWSGLRGNASCLIANLPGPEQPVLFASRTVKSIVNWTPPPHEVALAISFLTYGDQLRMSVIADEGVVTDPAIITKDFIIQLEKLSHLLSHRRIPGEHPGRRIDHLHDDGSNREPTVEEQMVGNIQQELWDIKVAIIRYFLQEKECTNNESDLKMLQAKMAVVQQQLQELKARLDTEDAERYSEEERALVDRVEQLKEEFRELLAELRRKRIAQGSSVLSDDEEAEDGELRRSSHRKRTLSGTSRRSIVSASAQSSTTRPLTTTSPPQSAHTASPPQSPPNSPVSPQATSQSQETHHG